MPLPRGGTTRDRHRGTGRTLQVRQQLLVRALEARAQHRAQLHRAAEPRYVPLCARASTI